MVNLSPSHSSVGFGKTIGNSLRRILLSAVEGCAVTSVRIEGIKHEYSTIPGVMEDVSDIIINIKKLCIRLDPEIETPLKLYIDVTKKGPVTGSDIQTEPKIEIVNKKLVIANLSQERELQMELEINRGRGYVTAEENIRDPQQIGMIPIASIFSPVRHVDFRTENTRVGKITNYDRLILMIKTDGSVTPEMALTESAKILRKHLNPFVQYFELGDEIPQDQGEFFEESEEEDEDRQLLIEKLDETVESLELGVRASNCLSSAGIRRLRDLVQRSESELLKIRNFGKTSLNEIKEKLKKMELSLGMQLDPSLIFVDNKDND